MTVGLVLDFAGGTRELYDQLTDRMQLGGQMAPGGRVHVAGSYAGGWRVIDVWDDLAAFERFRDAQIVPQLGGVGLTPPRMQVLEADDEMPDDGREPSFVQVIHMPGLDRAAFRTIHDEVVPAGTRPEGLTFHVNGPLGDGWCVIDGWTSKEIRDAFMQRTLPIVMKAPMTGEPRAEELTVQATLPGRAPATA